MEEVIDSGELFENGTTDFKLADNGQRLINYIIDYFIILVCMFTIGFTLESIGIALPLESNVFIYGFTWGIYLIYYTLCEHYLQGKTVGKYLTKTRAVTNTNEYLSLKSAFIRSVSRLVPFEAFSFFWGAPGGWHDHWADSMVIKE